jgi:hypothetical protein
VKAKTRATASTTLEETIQRKEKICIDTQSTAYREFFKLEADRYLSTHPEWLVKKDSWQERLRALVDHEGAGECSLSLETRMTAEWMLKQACEVTNVHGFPELEIVRGDLYQQSLALGVKNESGTVVKDLSDGIAYLQDGNDLAGLDFTNTTEFFASTFSKYTLADHQYSCMAHHKNCDGSASKGLQNYVFDLVTVVSPPHVFVAEDTAEAEIAWQNKLCDVRWADAAESDHALYADVEAKICEACKETSTCAEFRKSDSGYFASLVLSTASDKEKQEAIKKDASRLDTFIYNPQGLELVRRGGCTKHTSYVYATVAFLLQE